MATYTGTLVWLDSRLDKYDRYTCSIAVDPSSPDWEKFCNYIDDVCSEDDVCVSGPEACKQLGEWGANALNEHTDITMTWHESDHILRFTSKRKPTEELFKVGDTVTVQYDLSTYSFTPTGSYDVIEGVSLRLNDVY